MRQLPEKLSDCIEVALDDFESVEKDPKYTIDMNYWHSPFIKSLNEPNTTICHICFAGAVIARSLCSDDNEFFFPEDFDDYTKSRLYALDSVRKGYILNAVSLVMIGSDFTIPSNTFSMMIGKEAAANLKILEHKLFSDDFPSYQETSHFKHSMRKIAVKLKEYNL